MQHIPATGRPSLKPFRFGTREPRQGSARIIVKHIVSRELLAYWHGLRGARAAPERSDLDPAALRRVLADLFILGVDDPDAPLFPIRLAGARFDAFWSTGLRGTSMLGLFAGPDRAAMGRVPQDVLDHQVPALAGLTAAPPGDGRPVALEMLLLPLRYRGRTHARILGSAAPFGLQPWVGLTPVDRFDLASVRLSLGDGSDLMEQAAAAPRRHGHLLVHEGGRR